MKIGARILKTGITLIFAILLTRLFHLQPEIFAAIAATLAIQPSVYRSWRYGVEQIQANIVGATLATLTATFLGSNLVITALVVMLVIGINLQLGFDRSIPLAIVTVLSIMEGSQQEHFFYFAIDRFLLILIGIFAAILVNSLLFPPQYEKKLTKKLKNIEEQMASILRIALDKEKNEQTIKQTLDSIQNELQKLWDLYRFEEEAKSYLKRKFPFSSSRKLVILKNMLKTAQSGIEMIYMVQKYQNVLYALHDDLQKRFKDQLIYLAHYQDKIYSKYIGRIHPSPHHTLDPILHENHWALFKEIRQLTIDENSILALVILLGSIQDYGRRLDHLDRLIDSFYTHHN
ncbi:FUSC family protein [Tepidibacillus sp. LV47]|uniref:FUSC family protein n=1 Tax=Tepidibacillus sp. LV47 TaxID=3398228 RepID=UPI003AB04C1B